MPETLLNSTNPLAWFHRDFAERVLKPFLESHRRIHQEHVQKEALIIRQLDSDRQRAQFARDCRQGLLYKLVGKQARENEGQVEFTGGGLPTSEVVWTI